MNERAVEYSHCQTSHYFKAKTDVFLRGREVLDPQVYSEFLYPHCQELNPAAQSELAYCSADAPIPGFPANPRMLLSRLYLQLGTFLDYYTGEHDRSLSSLLRNAHSQPDLEQLIPPKHRALFPQFAVDATWPPTFLAHGSKDSAVLVGESINMHRLLQECDVESILHVVDGAEHSLDYVVDAEKIYGVNGGLFDEVRDFLVRCLQASTPPELEIDN